MGQEMYKREWLKDCVIIRNPGVKVPLRVAATVGEGNKVTTASGEKYIVQLKAIPVDKMENLEKLFQGKKEVPIKEMSKYLLSANLWVNNPQHPPTLPMRGEQVFVNIGFVNNKEKTKKVLRAVDIQVPPSKKPQVEEREWEKFFKATEQPPVNQKTGMVETKVEPVDDGESITH